jgi:(1->4)-alpha-D-glucan 1-alpha-D-glucosylmutase
MNNLLRVEMLSLGRQLADLAARDRYARNLPRPELLDVLVEATACFPVYRTYIRSLEVSESSKIVIERAIDEAHKRRPELNEACFDFLRDVLTLSNPPHVRSDQREERLNFVMRWQQFTGPIVAKGIEDTALYVYYPLLSLNEVGGNLEPSRIASREDFFEFIRERQRRWPNTLNASSTHDTKHSEDLRARLNVLSEIPDEWLSKLGEWSRENASEKKLVDGRDVPDANEEYLIYQTLLGLWPRDESDLPSICARLQSYIIKAIREAKIHTRWAEPNQAHEGAVSGFIERILDRQNHTKFLCSIAHFQERIGYAGMINALGETLLKIACPGVPDFYQGSEFWDIHLVDPDNRNPIDFPIRIQALQDLMDRAAENPAAIGSELLAAWPDGRLKMYVIWRTLGYRRQHSMLFTEGEFIPLEVVGQQSEHVIAFLRRQGKDQVIAILPRWMAKTSASSGAAATTDFWRGTNLLLPEGSPISWSDVFTASSTEAKGEAGKQWIAAGDLLKDFPIALLAANS